LTLAALAVVGCGRSVEVAKARETGRAMMEAAIDWRATHPWECPTVLKLREAQLFRVLSEESGYGARVPIDMVWTVQTTTDPWGSDFTIECNGPDVNARSPGPDRKLGTADDVVFP
jgi:hypothetical protein